MSKPTFRPDLAHDSIFRCNKSLNIHFSALLVSDARDICLRKKVERKLYSRFSCFKSIQNSHYFVDSMKQERALSQKPIKFHHRKML